MAAVIVENTFLSISHMVDALMPAIAPLKFLVLTMKWDSSVKIQSLAVPIMFIAGDRDELVPHEHMLQLHQLAGRSRAKELYIVKGGSHNGTWERGGSEYYLRILNFLEQHILAQLKLPSPPGESAAPAATAVESRAPREKDDEDYYIVDK